MRILADHDVWAVTLEVLRDAGHDVLTASGIGMTQAKDKVLLEGGVHISVCSLSLLPAAADHH